MEAAQLPSAPTSSGLRAPEPRAGVDHMGSLWGWRRERGLLARKSSLEAQAAKENGKEDGFLAVSA